MREVRDESIDPTENQLGLVTSPTDNGKASTASEIETLASGTTGYKKGAVFIVNVTYPN